jgi:hypothetical protein
MPCARLPAAVPQPCADSPVLKLLMRAFMLLLRLLRASDLVLGDSLGSSLEEASGSRPEEASPPALRACSEGKAVGVSRWHGGGGWASRQPARRVHTSMGHDTAAIIGLNYAAAAVHQGCGVECSCRGLAYVAQQHTCTCELCDTCQNFSIWL